jgi:predicted Zn-dependent peptidase
MSLIVVGDVRRTEIVGAARAFFQAPPNGAVGDAAPDLPDPGPMSGILRAEPLQRDRNLVTVVLAFRAPSVKAPVDSVAMDVLLNILAHGSGGRLAEALIRKQNRALAVSADYLTQRAPGIMTLTAIGRQGTEKEIEDALLAEIRLLREDGATPAEVEEAKRALLSQVLFDEETYAGQANALGFYDAIDTYDFAVQYPRRIRAIQPVDIGRVVQQYLTPDRYAVATVVPRRRTPPRPTGPDRSAEVTE